MAGIFIASSQIHESMPLRGIAELWANLDASEKNCQEQFTSATSNTFNGDDRQTILQLGILSRASVNFF